ncbi:uncharacterized protein LOC128571685 [Nycticebus coucang]|uniref:uncharacterized protein LOC128571685 n=1 Tax=Nycticebus coucang TaxID=9470 RepID=UPI00234C3A54|nr:uncharacterized protein LOC128571685 [Nycticebus coucang]
MPGRRQGKAREWGAGVPRKLRGDRRRRFQVNLCRKLCFPQRILPAPPHPPRPSLPRLLHFKARKFRHRSPLPEPGGTEEEEGQVGPPRWMQSRGGKAGGARVDDCSSARGAVALTPVTTRSSRLSRKGPSAHIPPPSGESRRRRHPAPRDPAGPAPSTAAPSALPGAGPGSPASYFYRTGLLATHFSIRLQVDPNLPGAPSPGGTLTPAPRVLARLNTLTVSPLKWTRSYLSFALPASLSPPPIFSYSPSFFSSFAFPPRLLISCNRSFILYDRLPHNYPPTPLKDSLPVPPPQHP